MSLLQPSADIWPAALLALPAGYGAWADWRERRLPNWLCGVTLLTGLAVTAGLATSGAAMASHLWHAALALLVGMALFAPGLIGGGDAKFYAAIAVWFPLAEGFRLLLLVGLAGLVLIAVMWGLVWRRHAAGQAVEATARSGAAQPRTVPYGVAIAAGALAAQIW